ncbi:MAG: LacI family DNA-binding transcriptional regulator [Myxococcales bacterium]|nr:LacI family DNA-binding transcriptional regulator [Myxococcales bacterium]
MAPRKSAPPPTVHPAYLAELRQRIESGPGASAVARRAGVSRMTVWRVIGGDGLATVEATEAIRQALAELEPDRPALPPPVVPVRGAAHWQWIQIGEQLLASAPAAVAAIVADPAALVAVVRGARARKPRAPRRRGTK